MTSSSTNPAIANAFAIESSSTHGGQALVYIATAEEMEGVGRGVNSKVALEKEVGFSVTPLEFDERAGVSITASESRQILKEMGINVPSQIRGASRLEDVLQSTPLMTRAEVNYYVAKAILLHR